MNAHETEIRRTANGSIDTDYYIRHVHNQRSLGAHRAIARLWALMGRMFKRQGGKPAASGEMAVAPASEVRELRKAA